MRAPALAFLFVGFGLGFAGVYPWMHARAPELAKPMPELAAAAAAPAEASAVSPPPLDTARVAELESLVAKDTKNVDALTELGNMMYDQGNFAEAVNWYQKAVEVQPGNIAVRTDLGGALFNANRVDESVALFKKSLELNPTHPQTLFDLGVVLLDGKNDIDGALQAWQKLVDTNPNFPQVALVQEQIARLKERQQQK